MSHRRIPSVGTAIHSGCHRIASANLGQDLGEPPDQVLRPLRRVEMHHGWGPYSRGATAGRPTPGIAPGPGPDGSDGADVPTAGRRRPRGVHGTSHHRGLERSGGFLLFLVVLLAFFYVLFALPVWGTYQKASPQGEPAWAAFVPVYNFIILLRVAGRPAWWAWFLLLPLFPTSGASPCFVISIIILNDISKSFGHGAGFTVGLVLLPIIFWFILWLGKSTYRGPQGPGRHGRWLCRVPRPGLPAPGGYAQPGYPQQATRSRPIRSRAATRPRRRPVPAIRPPPPPPGNYPPPPQPGTAYPPPPQPGGQPGQPHPGSATATSAAPGTSASASRPDGMPPEATAGQ